MIKRFLANSTEALKNQNRSTHVKVHRLHSHTLNSLIPHRFRSRTPLEFLDSDCIVARTLLKTDKGIRTTRMLALISGNMARLFVEALVVVWNTFDEKTPGQGGDEAVETTLFLPCYNFCCRVSSLVDRTTLSGSSYCKYVD